MRLSRRVALVTGGATGIGLETARQLRSLGNEVVICGMALGYADASAPINKLDTERVPVEEFAQFVGF